MSEDATLNEFIDSNPDESEERKKPELIKGVAWSTIEYLPDEWMVNNVESDINILSGNNFSSEYFVEEGGIPLIRIRDLAEDKTTVNFDGDYDSRYLINQQDLLIGMDGEFEPHLWTGPQALLNQRVCKIEPESQYNKIFFRYAIEKPLFYIQKSIAGTTVKHLSQSNINDLNLPTPSRPEQRKIATVLYMIDRAIEKTTEVIQQYGSLKSGVLDDLLRKGVKDDDQIERNIGPLTWEMPESWSVRTVGELAELVHGHQFRSGDFSDDGEIPVLKIGEITASGIDLSNADCVPEQELEDYADYTIEQDSPLIALSGATWGKTGYFESYNFPVLQNYRVGKVVADSSELDKKYLYYLMQSSIFQKQLRGQVVRQAQENIGKSDFERIRIPIPKINEQERIASIMSDIEDCIQNQERSKQTLEHLKRGLMQDLLSGTVRTTDTNIQVPDEIAQHG